MTVSRLAAYGLCGLVLISVGVGCLGSGTHRRRPLPRSDADRPTAELPPTVAPPAPVPAPMPAPAPTPAPAAPAPAAAAPATPATSTPSPAAAAPTNFAAPAAAPAATPPAAPVPTPAPRTSFAPLPPGGKTATELAMTDNGLLPVRTLQRLAAERFATLDGYSAQLRRREQVSGRDKPEEVMLCKFRKEPWSVYFQWIGTQGKGREVVYVKGRHGDLIHTLLAAGDMLVLPAGTVTKLAPENMFVRNASRHAITEAGLGTTIEQLGRVLDALEKGDQRFGTLRYLGPVQRSEFGKPVEGVEYRIPAGVEPPLAQGGKRWVFFDTANQLPVLQITYDNKDHEVEYYFYTDVRSPVRFRDEDFDPDKLWKKPSASSAAR